MSFDGDSFLVAGKRIYHPMILRAGIILFAGLLTGLIFQLSFLLLLMVMLILYYLVQYVLLKKESLTLAWPQIAKYEIDDRQKLISFSIENNSKSSPIVFTSENFTEIANIFRENIGDRERTSHGWTAVEQRYDDETISLAKSVDRWSEGKRR